LLDEVREQRDISSRLDLDEQRRRALHDEVRDVAIEVDGLILPRPIHQIEEACPRGFQPRPEGDSSVGRGDSGVDGDVHRAFLPLLPTLWDAATATSTASYSCELVGASLVLQMLPARDSGGTMRLTASRIR